MHRAFHYGVWPQPKRRGGFRADTAAPRARSRGTDFTTAHPGAITVVTVGLMPGPFLPDSRLLHGFFIGIFTGSLTFFSYFAERADDYPAHHMPSRGTSLRIRLIFFSVAGLILAHAPAEAQADLGANPSRGGDSVTTLDPTTTFSGTFSLSDEAKLRLSAGYTAPASTTFAFSEDATLGYTGLGPFTLTLPGTASLTRTGEGTTQTSVRITNAGTITVSGGTLEFLSGATFNNSGTATVTGAASNLILRGLTNTGTIRAQNSGTLTFESAYSTAALGTVQLATGGSARFAGTLNNAGATLNAPAGGSYTLYGGTITGGTIAAGALTFSGSAGYLDATTLNGGLILPASTSVRLVNGTTFTGANLDLGTNSNLYWQQSGTLASKVLAFASGTSLVVDGTGNTLTFGPGTTATGAVNISGSSDTTVINQGTLTHSSGSGQSIQAGTFTNSGTYTQTGGSSSIYGNTVTNSGVISASAGTLSLGFNGTGYTFANTAAGSITVSGGATVNLLAPVSNPITNDGAINVQNGNLSTNRTLTTSSTGSFTGGGTVTGNLAFTGGTLAPGNGGTGTLTLLGNLTLGSGTVTTMELGAGSNDRIAGIGTLTLGGQLNIVALSTSFTSGQSWNLFNAGTITGTFASINLPYTSSGWVWDTSQLATNGNLTLTTFIPIPEPSTYLLLASGLACVVALHRRRR